jgi:predicted dehydrogenase
VTTKNNLTLAQIGCGYWGPNLLRNFNANKHSRVKWVAEMSAKRRAFVEENYPNTKAIDNIDVILNDNEVDAVIVATPAATHFSIAKSVLEAGKHVFVEKPLSMSVKEAEILVQISKEKQLTLCVGHTFLYNAAVRKIKEYIDSGEVGEIYYIFAQRLNLGQVRQDVNAMWNLAPHDISIVLYWLGEEPEKVSARGLTFLQNGIEDVVFLNLDFPSGRAVHIHNSWLDPNKVRKMVIIGSKKMITYDDVSADAKITIYDKGIDKKTMLNPLQPISSFGQFQLMQRLGDVTIPFLKFREPLEIEAENFVDSILKKAVPQADGYSGLQVVKVLEAAQKSLKNNQETVYL